MFEQILRVTEVLHIKVATYADTLACPCYNCYMHLSVCMYTQLYKSLSMLALDNRDWHEKMVTEFFKLRTNLKISFT